MAASLLPVPPALIYSAAALAVAAVAHFLHLPSLLLYSLHTYIHPDAVPSTSPRAVLRPPSSGSGAKRGGAPPSAFDEGTNSAQLYRLRLSHGTLASRPHFGGYHLALLLPLAVLPPALLLRASEASPLAPLLPVAYLFVALLRLVMLPSPRPAHLASALGALLAATLLSSSPFAGALASLAALPASRFARAFWLGTDQPRTTASTAASAFATGRLPSRRACPPPRFPSSEFPRAAVAAARRRGAPAARAAAALSVRAQAGAKKSVLIVNANSGGHAVIGFYFAKELLAAGHAVTVLTVGDEASDKMKKPPFSRFSELTAAGGKTVWGDPADVGAAVGGASFDVVLDNNGKDLEAVKPVADWAKSAGVGQFLFISSAGIYKTTDEPPHVEGDAVKEDAGHVGVEKYIAGEFANWTSFRPQYMIGSGNNKDCEEWFFDRIVRGRPVPIPGSGMQVTNIAHVRDLSSMLALAVESPGAAAGRIFNCVCDRAVTFDGLVKLCAATAGATAVIVHYDPAAAGVDARKAFPFRNMHFYAEPRAAKEALGWTSTTNLPEDLKERFAEYASSGRGEKEMSFDLDDKILSAVGAAAVAAGV